MQKPLRILVVVDLPWTLRVWGAARVFIELAEAWQAAGHSVSKYCLTDAYPTPTSSGLLSAWRQMLFPRKAAAFVRQNADRFETSSTPCSGRYLFRRNDWDLPVC